MDKKVCVVGVGDWGKNHVRTLNEIGALSGAFDLDRRKMKWFKENYPNAKAYNSIKEALNDSNVRGFTIATEAKTHFEIAKTIMESKKHVLIEKPFTLNVDHASALVKLSEKNNLNLMVGHLLLFHPAIRKIKKIIDEGTIGDLQYIYSNRLNFGKIRVKENVFWSFAPHDIAIMQYLVGSYPIKIHSTGSSFIQKDIYDTTITTLKYEDKIEGHIFVSWLHPFKEHRLVVIGTEAMITFEDSFDEKPLKLYSKKIDLTNNIPQRIDGPTKIIQYEKKMPLYEELNYFVKNLDINKPLVSNGAHAFEVTKILIEASESLDSSL